MSTMMLCDLPAHLLNEISGKLPYKSRVVFASSSKDLWKDLSYTIPGTEEFSQRLSKLLMDEKTKPVKSFEIFAKALDSVYEHVKLKIPFEQLKGHLKGHWGGGPGWDHYVWSNMSWQIRVSENMVEVIYMKRHRDFTLKLDVTPKSSHSEKVTIKLYGGAGFERVQDLIEEDDLVNFYRFLAHFKTAFRGSCEYTLTSYENHPVDKLFKTLFDSIEV